MKIKAAILAMAIFGSGCASVNSITRPSVSLDSQEQSFLVESLTKAVQGLKLDDFLQNNRSVQLQVTAGLANVGDEQKGETSQANPNLASDVKEVLTLVYAGHGISFTDKDEGNVSVLKVHVLVHGLEEADTNFLWFSSKSIVAKTKLAASLWYGNRMMGMTLADGESGD